MGDVWINQMKRTARQTAVCQTPRKRKTTFATSFIAWASTTAKSWRCWARTPSVVATAIAPALTARGPKRRPCFPTSFIAMLEQQWTPRRWNGPKQYANADGDLMMLPADLALIQDEKFRVWVEKYAADEDLFFKDFAKAFQKLQENGVQAFAKPWYQFW